MKHAIGVPAVGLGSSMFAFGAYLKSSGFDLFQSFSSSFFTFALPGQFVMAETLVAGGTLLNIFLAVFLTNARLYPMTVNLIPVIRHPHYPKYDNSLRVVARRFRFVSAIWLAARGFVCTALLISVATSFLVALFE